ncbi:hypothetical protein ES705_34582 [subsurface metagenome]
MATKQWVGMRKDGMLENVICYMLKVVHPENE